MICNDNSIQPSSQITRCGLMVLTFIARMWYNYSVMKNKHYIKKSIGLLSLAIAGLFVALPVYATAPTGLPGYPNTTSGCPIPPAQGAPGSPIIPPGNDPCPWAFQPNPINVTSYSPTTYTQTPVTYYPTTQTATVINAEQPQLPRTGGGGRARMHKSEI